MKLFKDVEEIKRVIPYARLVDGVEEKYNETNIKIRAELVPDTVNYLLNTDGGGKYS